MDTRAGTARPDRTATARGLLHTANHAPQKLPAKF